MSWCFGFQFLPVFEGDSIRLLVVEFRNREVEWSRDRVGAQVDWKFVRNVTVWSRGKEGFNLSWSYGDDRSYDVGAVVVPLVYLGPVPTVALWSCFAVLVFAYPKPNHVYSFFLCFVWVRCFWSCLDEEPFVLVGVVDSMSYEEHFIPGLSDPFVHMVWLDV